MNETEIRAIMREEIASGKFACVCVVFEAVITTEVLQVKSHGSFVSVSV